MDMLRNIKESKADELAARRYRADTDNLTSDKLPHVRHQSLSGLSSINSSIDAGKLDEVWGR